jgi:formylglycine-generating enzyme required for sulfatase activity/serine/threonine protein kinase
MAARLANHPSSEILSALGSGALDDATAAAVLAHLDGCQECCQAATNLLGDSSLRRLRAAHFTASTLPAGRAADETHGPRATPAPVKRPDVLPELRDHPLYEVLRELDRGSMGVVYLAKNKLMDRPEVLKVVNPQLLSEPGMAERFLREIRSAAQLRHPNIATAYSALQVGDLLLFAMEYVEGENLARVVKGRGPLPVVNACYYVQQAALGLQHAFQKGMVHRDIKPGNLILAREGKKHTVKILDFGLARATRGEGAAGHELTGSGQMLGTPDFIAPEQSEDATRADIRSDIYSLGCTLYFLLAGRPPFQAKSLFGLLQAHASMEATPLNEVRKEVPPELAAVVAKMMSKDPAQRYQKPVEVAAALAPFARTGLQPLPASPSTEKETPPVAGSKTEIGRVCAQETVLPRSARPARRAEGQATVGWPTKGAATERDQSTAAKGSGKWWAVLLGGLALLLLVSAIGLWAGGVFRLKTAEGILVVEVDEPNPDVYVDGSKMTVTWGADGKTAEIRLKPGTRKVEVKKDGFTAFGEEVELQDGKRRVLTARLVSQAPPVKPEKGRDQVPAPTPIGGGAVQPPKPVEKPIEKPAPPTAGEVVAEVKKVAGIDLASIPAGEFYMGSPPDDKDALPEEKPRHKVRITKPFHLGKYHVTVGQFRRFIEATGHTTEAEKAGDIRTWGKPGFDQTDECPVVCVSWNDADAFCRWLAKESGVNVRLPREAEWEFACRANTTTRFYFGDNQANLGDYAWYDKNSGNRIHACGLKKPNAFGLYDMHGLAWQWCADGQRTYTGQAQNDPEGPTNAGGFRVIRGGCAWYVPRLCRAAHRDAVAPSDRNDHFSFRVLVQLPPADKRQEELEREGAKRREAERLKAEAEAEAKAQRERWAAEALEREEKEASGPLKLAKKLLQDDDVYQNDNAVEARQILRKIVKDWPKTKAAAEAKGLLPSTKPDEQDEDYAAAQVKYAKKLIDQDDTATAKERLLKVVKDYPESKSAPEARELLKMLGK